MKYHWGLLIVLLATVHGSCRKETLPRTDVIARETSIRNRNVDANKILENTSVITPIPTVKKENPSIFDRPAEKRIKELDRDEICEIEGDELGELSGIIPAREKGEYWGHNDKGNDSEIFRFNRDGRILQKVLMMGIMNDDWEAITREDDGSLFIGGFGDNDRERFAYHIYQFSEPKMGMNRCSNIPAYTFLYADNRPHNCEAFFPFSNRLYLITKERDEDDSPLLFCIERLDKTRRNIAQYVGVLDFEGVVTDAAYSKKHALLAILTYEKIVFYRLEKERDLRRKPFHIVDIDCGQCEGMCFDDEDLIVTNEDGKIWVFPLSMIFPL